MEEINKNYEIKCGDCLELIKDIKDKSIDCIITDPPYFLGVTHNGREGNYIDLAIMKPFFEQLFFEFKRVIKDNGCIYIFCDWRTYPFHFPIFEKIIGLKNLLVWAKHGRPTQTYYGNGYELIMFSGRIRKPYISNIIENIKSFNAFSVENKKLNGEKIHPTQKPIELVEKLILDSTKENETVLDCFMGSGSTGVACIKNNRRFIGYELDENYYKNAEIRIKKFL